MNEKHQARYAVTQAVRKGQLVKTPCEICGEIKVDAHHYKGYAKRNWLKIKWLCRKHHARREKVLLDFRDEAINEIYKLGYTIKEIGIGFNMSHQNVWKIISLKK